MTYREVLALPGVTPLMSLALLARVPASAAAITLTLHVVLTLDLGYAAAGAVGAASTIGMAIGAPVLGRLVDRRGLRTMLAVTIAAAAAFWAAAPYLDYPALLVGAFLGGLLAFPVYSIIRQALASAVPPDRRRPAFALDSMSVEVSYIIGPAVGSLLVVTLSSPVAMTVVGVGWVATGLAFWVLDPPTRTGPADPGERPPPVRTWLDRRLVAALLATAATVLLVFGTELDDRERAGVRPRVRHRTGQRRVVRGVARRWLPVRRDPPVLPAAGTRRRPRGGDPSGGAGRGLVDLRRAAGAGRDAHRPCARGGIGTGVGARPRAGPVASSPGCTGRPPRWALPPAPRWPAC